MGARERFCSEPLLGAYAPGITVAIPRGGEGGDAKEPVGRRNRPVGWQERARAELEPGDLGRADRPADQTGKLARGEQVAPARRSSQCFSDTAGTEPAGAQAPVRAPS